MADWFEYSTRTGNPCRVIEVDDPPIADTYGGHALQFLLSRAPSARETWIDLSWMLGSEYIGWLEDVNWVAGSGTVSISSDKNGLLVDGDGCVNFAIAIGDSAKYAPTYHIAVQTYTCDTFCKTYAWNGDEVTLADVVNYKTYKMPGNPCHWVCSNAPGAHEPNDLGPTEMFNDRYVYWKPLVFGFKATDTTAGELIASEKATASEMGTIFANNVGMTISQRCRVTADSGAFTVNGYLCDLQANAKGTVTVRHWGRDFDLTVNATTDPYSYTITPESIKKALQVGKSIGANGLFEWEALGGDGKTHLRTVLDDGGKYVTISDADGKGTVTATAVGEARLGIWIIADTTGDWKSVATLTVTVTAGGGIVIGSHEWATTSDAIIAGGKAVKAVYVCEGGELKQVYG